MASFALFYLTIELLLFANREVFGPNVIGNDIIFALISFLNIVPSGIFAFAVVSALHEDETSELSETRLLAKRPVFKSPRVAVLYTTYNDFILDDADYDCAEARERGYPFFILDDSNRAKKKEEIDSFAAERDGCYVVRRDSRKGFKAGAMNNWAKIFGKNYDYAFILDSDSRASADAIEYCVDLARRDARIALVQTRTMTTSPNPTAFTMSGVTIQHAYMAVVQNSMKNLGSSPYYGHNALLKIEALNSVGGLVEESNEDYKTLARLHHKGYKSVYASRATTWEEIPPDYYSARKRSLRWARDAVGQLGLLKFRVPLPMAIYLFYGWVTYMTNIALLSLFLMLSFGSLSLQVSSMGLFGTIAGVMTMSVIILWPLLALRVKDPELTPKSLLSAVAFGYPFNAPMMAPVSAQIAKTTVEKLWQACKRISGVGSKGAIEEFIVTPKVRVRTFRLSSVVASLKLEIAIGLIPLTIAVATSARYFLLFSIPQIGALVLLPLFISAESRGRPIIPLQRHVPASAKEYARGVSGPLRYDATPQYAYLLVH